MKRGMVAAELTQTLKSLLGKCCWGVSAGEGTGSVFILSFGGKVPRVRPIANPHFTSTQRRYIGELSLTVRSAWRIDSDGAD